MAENVAGRRPRLVDPSGLDSRAHLHGTSNPFVIDTLRLGRRAYVEIQRFFPWLLAAVIVLGGVQMLTSHDGLNLFGGQLKNAIVFGAIYALIAIGYTMVYGIIELINFAHGDVFTLSGFYAYLIVGAAGGALGTLAAKNGFGLFVGLLILFPVTMFLAGLTGMLIERVAYRRLRDSPRLAPLITAIGMSFFLEGLMLVLFGADNKQTGLGTWIQGNAISFGQVQVAWTDIFVVVTAVSLMFALGAFVRLTRLGKAMRATAQDRNASLICGINVNATISATFFIGSALAAAGAIVYSLSQSEIQWNLGYRFGIFAFTAAVLGGVGNIVGAGVGGFLIGLLYVFGGQIFGPEWSDSIVFAMLVIILTFRPVGLFGVDVTTRA